jgi:pullulanase-type alpha-1,6-glucosidase
MFDIKNNAHAHWLAAEYIAWPVGFGPETLYRLHYDPAGNLKVSGDGLQGGKSIPLEFFANRLLPELAERFPHLRDTRMLRIPKKNAQDVTEILKGQLAVSAARPGGSMLIATGVQIPGVLDDLYANDEPLGIKFEDGVPTLRVWAPTAKSVTLHLFSNPKLQTAVRTFPMAWDPETGVWSARGKASWIQQYYCYEVEVYVRDEGRVVRNLVTDPYSVSLAMDSSHSQIIDLSDSSLKPPGWDELEKPRLESFTDIALYELHLRDFGAFDPLVPEEHRGTYLAFTHARSHGMRHLKRLAQAGLTHVHLLPVFDIATILEDKSAWLKPDYEYLAQLPPDSDQQQAILQRIRGWDGYNWGYDPYHYAAPEGSYATQPDGTARIREFRQMIMALNQIGLRVVMDVAYNHTHAAGQAEKSVLDRVVPGYYHRLDGSGKVITSTCCPNTASEHAMMEKLMIDSLLTWAKEYKVDGFRFDLMGHHMVENMKNVRAALDSLTIDKDGIDGRKIFMYGEGWDFGEVANNARGINATQFNLAGSGIGTFNDRIRDAVRGGGPFRGLLDQGFATGLYLDPNEVNAPPSDTDLIRLLELKDQIRVSLAGNLADFRVENAAGHLIRGADAAYNGHSAGYTRSAQENIAYVSAHDNETLFDAIQYKAPLSAGMDERVRMQNLALSFVAFSQGVPFFHAGCEILRSKSLDRDSYDSGDWFNRLDYTYQTNNWAVGLPPEDKNGQNWPIMKELLARPELKPDREHILRMLAHFEELLCIRKSSALFRLNAAEEVIDKVRFHNTGPHQVPGLIVMSIRDHDSSTPFSMGAATESVARGDSSDGPYDLLVVVFNADKERQSFAATDLAAVDLALHPVQAASADPKVREAAFDRVSGTFQVPGRTTAVFVREREISSNQ